MASIIDRNARAAEEIRFTNVPKKGGRLDILPLVIEDRGVYARNGNGRYSKIGHAHHVPWSIMFALNCQLLRRCVKTVPDHWAYLTDPTSPVVFIGEGITALQMPMRAQAHEWLGEGWRDEEVAA